MADLVDLKSPYLAGHSRGVANLAAAAARAGRVHPDDDVAVLRRAGLIHDLGRGRGVSNAIWEKPGPPHRGRVRACPAAPLPDRPGRRPG